MSTSSDTLPAATQNQSVDLVVSGVNEGSNLGPLVYTLSGTLGAAYVAVGRGIPAIAVSGQNSTKVDYKDWDPEDPLEVGELQIPEGLFRKRGYCPVRCARSNADKLCPSHMWWSQPMFRGDSPRISSQPWLTDVTRPRENESYRQYSDLVSCSSDRAQRIFFRSQSRFGPERKLPSNQLYVRYPLLRHHPGTPC